MVLKIAFIIRLQPSFLPNMSLTSNLIHLLLPGLFLYSSLYLQEELLNFVNVFARQSYILKSVIPTYITIMEAMCIYRELFYWAMS